MKKILNVSNHQLTNEQVAELRNKWEVEVMELPEGLKQMWSNLTPDNYKMVSNAIKGFAFDEENEIVMLHVAGFPAAVNYLCNEYPGTCLYAYSERVSVDVPQDDGSIKKVSQFKHKGFYRYD